MLTLEQIKILEQDAYRTALKQVSSVRDESRLVLRQGKPVEYPVSRLFIFFYSIYALLENNRIENLFSGLEAFSAEEQAQIKPLVLERIEECYPDEYDYIIALQAEPEVILELERLINLQSEQSKIIRDKAQKLKELWAMGNCHAVQTDLETREKGIVAMQLVINLCKETKRAIQDDGNINNNEVFSANWAKHFNNAAPILRKSRSYAAILADLITAPVLFIPQIAYRLYAGTWGMFSASKTFRTAIEAEELVHQLPKPKMPGR